MAVINIAYTASNFVIETNIQKQMEVKDMMDEGTVTKSIVSNEEIQPAEVEATETKVETEEVKTETTETKEEVKEAKPEDKVENKTFFDNFKKGEEKKEEKTETKAVEVPKEIEDKIKELESQLEKYNNPLAKLLGGDYDLTNVDLKELFKNAVGQDFSGLSNEQLIEKELSSAPEWNTLTDEEKEEELDRAKSNFDQMGKLGQAKERNRILQSLTKEVDTSEIFKTLKEVQEGQKNLTNPEEFYQKRATEDFNNYFEKVKGEISELATSIVGQKYGEFEVTKEVADEIVKIYEDQTLNFTPEKIALNAFKVASYDAAITAAEQRGYEKAIKEKSNPSFNNTSGVIAPTETDNALKNSKTEDFFDQANK